MSRFTVVENPEPQPEPTDPVAEPEATTPPGKPQSELFPVAEESPDAKSGKASGRAAPRFSDGLKAPSPVGKNFVLDTNVLLHDPDSLNRFADNHVCIPLDVLSELDRFKNEQSERGANARAVHRTLVDLFSSQPEAATRGIPTPSGGSVRLIVNGAPSRKSREAIDRLSQVLPQVESIDHRLLVAVQLVQQANQAPVILVTKDLNLQLKAHALGLPCEDYRNDKVESTNDGDPMRLLTLPVEGSELQRFASSGELILKKRGLPNLDLNAYALLEAGPGRTMPARYVGDHTFVRLRHPESIRVQKGAAIRPLNLGQQCFLDALSNPEISLITCFGQAGTGKTLLAVASALQAVFAGDYSGVTVSRPVVPLGDTLGFLPGALEEKLHPWLKPIFDALEFIMSPPDTPERRRSRRHSNTTNLAKGPVQKPYEPMLESGMIEVEALCYIRGRSIPSRFFILDEAQQLTPLEAKTIVTRMARGSKLVLVGDPAQIDNPYVDRQSNGLVYTHDRLRNQPCTAHVTLERGERSELAEAGARLM